MKVAEGTSGGSELLASLYIGVSIAQGSQAQVNAYFFGVPRENEIAVV